MPTVVDHSALQVARECKRKYFWTYIRKLDPGRSDPMEEGRAVHEGLYTWYKTGSIDEAMRAIIIERPTGMLQAEAPKYDQMEVLMRELVDGYTKAFPTESFEVVQGEVPLMWEIAPDFFYVGIIDQVVKIKEGPFGVHEFKRSKQIASDWVARLQLDHQTVGYVTLARRNGIPAKFITLSVLRATKYPEYVRDSIIVPDWLVQEFEAEMRNFWGEMVTRRERYDQDGDYIQWYPKTTDSCFKWNQPCPFHKLCTETAEMRETLIKEGFYKRRAERELGILERAKGGIRLTGSHLGQGQPDGTVEGGTIANSD